MNKHLFAASLLSLFSAQSIASECSDVLRLSSSEQGTTLKEDSFNDRAKSFCDEYSKSKQDGSGASLSVSYADIGFGGASSSSSASKMASKYCSNESDRKVKNTAYQTFSNTIAKGGFRAYESCLQSQKKGLAFKVLNAGEKEAILAIGYKPSISGGSADVQIGSTSSINCRSSSFSKNFKDNNNLTLNGNTTIKVTCNRKDSSVLGAITVAMFNTGDPATSFGIPWTAYSNGAPISEVMKYRDAVSKLQEATEKYRELTTSLSEISKSVSDVNSRLKLPNGKRKVVSNKSGYGRESNGKSKRGFYNSKLMCPAKQYVCGLKQIGKEAMGSKDDYGVTDLDLICCTL